MPSRLTDTQIISLKPTAGNRLEVFDGQEPGLLLRVSKSGSRTWYWRYRLIDGRQPRFKLGTYPATSIAEARRKAQDARRIVEAGKDPAALQRKAEAEARGQKIRTYDDLTTAYFTACETGFWTPRNRRKKATTIWYERRLYARHIQKEFGRRLFAEIVRADIKTLVRGLLAKGITAQANHAHALVRQTFSYALEEELVAFNPAMGMASPAPKRVRERVLDDRELKLLWETLKAPGKVLDVQGKPLLISEGVSIALRLTALLLQRRAEIATMRIDDLDLDQGVWMIPSDQAKNGRTHFVPLPPQSVRLIREAMKIKSRADSAYLFPSPRNKAIPVTPDALTRTMAQTMKALKRPLAGPHDLRRTGASMLASERCAVMPFIISQVLGLPPRGDPVSMLVHGGH